MNHTPPTSNRSQQLRKLGSQLPDAIGRQAQQAQDANVVGLQQAVQKTLQTGGRATAGQVQQMGAQATAQRGQTQVAAAQRGAAQSQQLLRQGNQAEAADRRLSLARRGLQLERDGRRLEAELEQLNATLKQEIFDKQMSFEKDELGRVMWNERQLADAALLAAKDDAALQDFEMQVNYYSQLRMTALRSAHQKITQAMEQAHRYAELDKDNALKLRLAQAKAELDRKMQQEAARQRNRGAVWSAVGTVVGAVVGGVLTMGTGAAAGAAAGAALGQGLGNVAAGASS